MNIKKKVFNLFYSHKDKRASSFAGHSFIHILSNKWINSHLAVYPTTFFYPKIRRQLRWQTVRYSHRLA